MVEMIHHALIKGIPMTTKCPSPIIGAILFLCTFSFITSPAQSSVPLVLYSQPPAAMGNILQSSRKDSGGSDNDQYVWDNFALASANKIDEIEWYGAYDPAKLGAGGPVAGFSVAIFASIPGGTQPDVTNPPLVQYTTNDNAGETSVGSFGGAIRYHYSFLLPSPFKASGKTAYWLQIEALQHGSPDWGIAAGTGGDGRYFRRIASLVDVRYQSGTGDAAFVLIDPPLSVEGFAGRTRLHPQAIRQIRSGSLLDLFFPEELVEGEFSLCDLSGKVIAGTTKICSTSMRIPKPYPLLGLAILRVSKNGEAFAGQILPLEMKQ